MKVKIKYLQVMHETEKATLFSIKNIPVWLPNSCFSYGNGNFIVCSDSFAREKGLEFKPLYHVPQKIPPIRNQEPHNDLIFKNT